MVYSSNALAARGERLAVARCCLAAAILNEPTR